MNQGMVRRDLTHSMVEQQRGKIIIKNTHMSFPYSQIKEKGGIE